jgi:hypothetical protein
MRLFRVVVFFNRRSVPGASPWFYKPHLAARFTTGDFNLCEFRRLSEGYVLGYGFVADKIVEVSWTRSRLGACGKRGVPLNSIYIKNQSRNQKLLY